MSARRAGPFAAEALIGDRRGFVVSVHARAVNLLLDDGPLVALLPAESPLHPWAVAVPLTRRDLARVGRGRAGARLGRRGRGGGAEDRARGPRGRGPAAAAPPAPARAGAPCGRWRGTRPRSRRPGPSSPRWPPRSSASGRAARSGVSPRSSVWARDSRPPGTTSWWACWPGSTRRARRRATRPRCASGCARRSSGARPAPRASRRRCSTPRQRASTRSRCWGCWRRWRCRSRAPGRWSGPSRSLLAVGHRSGADTLRGIVAGLTARSAPRARGTRASGSRRPARGR